MLREVSQPVLGQTTLTTSFRTQHTLKITDLVSGYHGDSSWGALDYTIDGEAFEWEFHSGYYVEGAAVNIMSNLGDKNEALEDDIAAWLEELDLMPRPFDTDAW